MNYTIPTRTRIGALLKGFLLLLCAIAVVGCSNDEEGIPTGGNQIKADAYIQATIDGQLITMQNETTADGYSQGVGASRGPGEGAGYLAIERSYFVRYVIEQGRPKPLMNKSMEMSFIKKFDEQPANEAFGQAIQLGDMPFGSKTQQIEGVEITWIDATGQRWTSVGDQTGSSFKVDTHKESSGGDLPSRFRTTGAFSCRLYNSGGQSIAVESGKFALRTILP